MYTQQITYAQGHLILGPLDPPGEVRRVKSTSGEVRVGEVRRVKCVAGEERVGEVHRG